MKIYIFPDHEKRKKCLLLVGGSGDTVEVLAPLVKELGERLPEHGIVTFSLSSRVNEGVSLLETQTAEVKEVMKQLAGSERCEQYDIWSTSMGAYAVVKLLIDTKYSARVKNVVLFDPADYYLTAKFTAAEEGTTWSGGMDYQLGEPTISGQLSKYTGEAVINVVHLTLRNYGRNGYIDREYADRGDDHPGAFSRLNTAMVKRFYETVPEKNRGKYVEINNIPHGFIRDGKIPENLKLVAKVVTEMISLSPAGQRELNLCNTV